MGNGETWATFWMTRDESLDGKLSDGIDIWTARPARHNLIGGGVAWLGPGDTGMECRHETWTTAFCLLNVHVYPEDSRQCIKYGNEDTALPVKVS